MLEAIRSEWRFDKGEGWPLSVRLYNAAWIARDELRKAVAGLRLRFRLRGDRPEYR